MAFALDIQTSIELRQGESAKFTIHVLATAKPYRNVSLSVSQLPAGVMASPTLASGKPSFDAIITLVAAANAPVGDYQFKVTARDAKSSKTLMPIVTLRAGLANPGPLPPPPGGSDADYFVATTGNDTTGDGSSGNPWLTLNKAFATIGASAGAGADLIVEMADGIYTATVSTQCPSGTSGHPFTVRAANHLGVTIRPTADITILNLTNAADNYQTFNDIVFDGVNQTGTKFAIWHNLGAHITIDSCEFLNMSGSAVLIQAHFATVRDCLIHDTGSTRLDHGIYCTGSDGLFELNTIYNLSGFGVHIFSNDPAPYNLPSRNVVRKNIVYDFANDHSGGSTGILGSVGTDNVIYNNIIYTTTNNPDAYALSMDSGNFAYNNTMYHCGAQGLGVPVGATARNNIVYQCGTDTSGGGTFSNNWVTADGDPNLVNIGTNFHLTSSSPATVKTGGFDLTGTVSDDFDGIARPHNGTYSIGAYELP